MLRADLIKRDVLEGDRSIAAAKLIRKTTRKWLRAKGTASANGKGDADVGEAPWMPA